VTQSSSAKADKEREDSCSCSEDELESCPVSAVVSSKPPLSKPLAETNGAYNGLRSVERRRRPVESDSIGAEEDARMVVSARRFERRQRSKSDITGLVSAGIALEEEKEEERKEEERKEEERRREERRKEEKRQEERKQEERRQEERRQEERRQEERRQEERRQEERRQEEKRQEEKRQEEKRCEEKRKEERRERDRLLRAVHDPAPVDTPVSEAVREKRQEGISSNSGSRWLAEEERVRKGSVYSSGEYQPVSLGSSNNNYVKVANSAPKPFNLSRQLSRDRDENGASTLTTTATVTLGRPQEASQSQGGSETSNSATSWGIPGAKLLSPPPQEKKEKERSPKFFGDNNKENRKSQSKEVRTRGEQRRADQAKEGDVTQVEVEVETIRRDSGTTSDILAACKSGLRRLTYRKTYTRTRSHPLEEGQEEDSKQSTKSVAQSPERGDLAATERATRYTTGSSGSRIPNRPTTPGPYFGVDRPKTPGPYRPFSPTPGASITSPSIARESWKRTNQKFNYSRYKYGTHETFV